MKSPPSSNSWNGRFIGDNQRYRLDKQLASGGMGEVFLATDTRVGQQVALKLLKDTLVASAEMRKRFEREIAVCAALQSDHIVKITDCGVTPEGFPFYVMEYLRGQTLRQLLQREKRLSVERTTKIITQVCKGLQLAHQGVTVQRDGKQTIEHIKVIHRDLKPDNIFLVPTDLGEWVKILDFGVAKIRNESSDQTNITSTFIGTFRYAAPEQIQNDQNLGPRADIYSLGIILYEMLSAADPFGLNFKHSNISEASWVLAHSYEPPKSLREQPGCEQLPLPLEAVVIKCLQKNPDNRFASVEELNQALQAAVKPVTGTGSVKRDNTIVQPQPAQNQGVNYDTIERPLGPVAPNQSADDTVLRYQPLQNQGSNHETVPGRVNPVAPNQSADDTVLRHQPLQNQAANYETVDRPLNPVVPGQPEGTIFQPRPSQNHGSDPNAEASNSDGTLYQQRPGTYPGGQPVPPDGTLYQPKPRTYPGGQQLPSDRTEFQQRQGTHSGGQPPSSENTQFQPRHGTHSGGQPQSSDRTEFQPRQGTHSGGQPQSSENTQFQPRQGTHSGGQQIPENTLVQRKENEQPSDQLPVNFWRNLGIVIALGLALGAIIYIYPRFMPKNSNNGQGVPKFDRITR